MSDEPRPEDTPSTSDPSVVEEGSTPTVSTRAGEEGTSPVDQTVEEGVPGKGPLYSKTSPYITRTIAKTAKLARLAAFVAAHPTATHQEQCEYMECSLSSIKTFHRDQEYQDLLTEQIEAYKQATVQAVTTQAKELATLYIKGEKKLLEALENAPYTSPTLVSKGADLVIRRTLADHAAELEREKVDASSQPTYTWLPPIPSRRLSAPYEHGKPLALEDHPTTLCPRVVKDLTSYSALTIGFQPHAGQARLASKFFSWYEDRDKNPRHMVLKTGRRYGKTESILSIADALCHTPDWWSPKGPPSVLIVCPSHKQARKIYFTHGLVQKRFGKRAEILETQMTIKFPNGATITIAGVENPGAQEGVGHDLIVVDEAGLTRGLKKKIQTTLLSMLGDRSGRLLIVGTPKGLRAEYTSFIDQARNPDNHEWELFEGASIDNPHYPLAEVETMRLNMDEPTFRQEFLGEVISQEGTIFAFDRDTHVRATRYDPDLPLCISWDFNNNPVSILVGQVQRNEKLGKKQFVFLDEMQFNATFTQQSAINFCQSKWGKHRGKVLLYGDATGSAEDSTSGTSDWALIESVLGAHFKPIAGIPRVEHHYEDSNPALVDSDNAVNCALQPGDEKTMVAIDPSCTGLIADFENLIWPEDGSRRRAKSRAEAKGFGHLCDCARYWIAKVRPIQSIAWN